MLLLRPLAVVAEPTNGNEYQYPYYSGLLGEYSNVFGATSVNRFEKATTVLRCGIRRKGVHVYNRYNFTQE